MPFFYIYHSLRRRTRFEEQQDFIFAWRSWCCCAVSMEAKSNRMGTRTHEERTAQASAGKLLWCAHNVLCMANTFELTRNFGGYFLLVCLVVSLGFCLAKMAIPWAA